MLAGKARRDEERGDMNMDGRAGWRLLRISLFCLLGNRSNDGCTTACVRCDVYFYHNDLQSCHGCQ